MGEVIPYVHSVSPQEFSRLETCKQAEQAILKAVGIYPITMCIKK